MKKLLKYLFSCMVVGLSAAVYHTVSQKPSARFAQASTSSSTQKLNNRSIERAARHAKLEQDMVIEDAHIPVSFQLVNQAVGHTPVVKPIESVKTEQVAVDKSGQTTPGTTFASHSHTPQASDFDQSAQYPYAGNDYGSGYYPTNYGNNNSHAPSSMHSTPQHTNFEQPKSDLSDLVPKQSEKDEVQKEKTYPYHRRSRVADSSDVNVPAADQNVPAMVSQQVPAEEELELDTPQARASWLQRTMQAAFMAAVSPFLWAKLGVKKMFETSKDVNSQALGDGAFLPFWIPKWLRDRSTTWTSSGGSGSGPAQLQITDGLPTGGSAQVPMVQAQAQSVVAQSFIPRPMSVQTPGLWNSLKNYFSGPVGAWRMVSMMTKGAMLGTFAYRATQADQKALTDTAHAAGTACARNLVMPNSGTTLPAVAPTLMQTVAAQCTKFAVKPSLIA